ncbi:50S ribosomal protein L5 [uncultured archaeon]|nr:50S ribosomal protein L5 [uncultured archaeon]
MQLNLVRIDKVTLNIGVGQGGEKLENAKALLKKLTGLQPVDTLSKTRNPTWKVRMGDAIGCKVTLRGENAVSVLKRVLDSLDFVLKPTSFDNNGNVSFGVKEYIDVPGLKYDPKIGILGFDVCVSLGKPGYRVMKRRIKPGKIPRKHRVSQKEAQEFLQKNFDVKFEEAA